MMQAGFYKILAAQFFSALADNALFFAALALLKSQQAPEWHLSMLLWGFTVSYVLIAPYAGALADARPKNQVMMICNGIKLFACLLMGLGASPLWAYALVGLGAAAYSPAKYGLITESLAPAQLVAANGWLESSTVFAIILGTLLGGYLSGSFVSQWLAGNTLGNYLNGIEFSILIISLLYSIAAAINAAIARPTTALKPLYLSPRYQIAVFYDCLWRLWRDPQGQVSMAITTLFWGAGATMRLVVLNWALLWLAIDLESATRLIAVVAVGIAIGALLAGRYVSLPHAFRVMPAGLLMGVLLICMLWVNQIAVAALLLLLIGILSGFFVVPLNAVLQHRGQQLMGAGHSIAVQNFNENLGILIMVGLHALMIKYLSLPLAPNSSALLQVQYATHGVPPMQMILISFGLLVIITMSAIMVHHHRQVLTHRR
ncbi:lysophospholipid transporter LplT [uncultured Deefgea sp.]|uniref:lysophospholipid transporter LplT n=1 Tax=uncultured Deefgea sp. TaxID=1304914 RepID=UPI002595BB08|nr:lysophospholipid transporter LplT [uncultured Deefgea sp.]